MTRALLATALLAIGCGAPRSSPPPDAAPVDAGVDAGPDADLLPYCVALGCPNDQPLLCTSNGRSCVCPTDAGVEPCQRGTP